MPSFKDSRFGQGQGRNQGQVQGTDLCHPSETQGLFKFKVIIKIKFKAQIKRSFKDLRSIQGQGHNQGQVQRIDQCHPSETQGLVNVRIMLNVKYNDQINVSHYRLNNR